MSQKDFLNILDEALSLKEKGVSKRDIIKHLPPIYKDELIKFLEISEEINVIRDQVIPPKTSLRDLLSSLPNDPVTKMDYTRYNFSKDKNSTWIFTRVLNSDYINIYMWKFALIAVVIVLIASIAIFKYSKGSQSSLPQTQNYQTPTQNSQNQTTPNQSADIPNQIVTQDNADPTLQQTDMAVSQASDQVDQDLNALDQTNPSENDLNNL